jgi:hypothetical protein
MISLVLSIAFILAILDYCIGWESFWHAGIGVLVDSAWKFDGIGIGLHWLGFW